MLSVLLGAERNLQAIPIVKGLFSPLLFACALVFVTSSNISAQQTPPVVIQPGAPGKASRQLPSDTRASLPSVTRTDVGFMQGMVMHHAQAVEMTALIDARTDNRALRLLGARISHSQAEEMKFMRRWLETRGESTSMPMPKMDMSMPGMDMSSHQHTMLMPGMLTPAQMDALKNAKGAEFDRVFLKGMIQHHGGALTMVKELFDSAGSGQDAELFNFATDVDSGQRAEIRIMQNMLGDKP